MYITLRLVVSNTEDVSRLKISLLRITFYTKMDICKLGCYCFLLYSSTLFSK